jgi:hypothetical protein
VEEVRVGPLTLRDLDAVLLDLGPLREVSGSPVAGLLPAHAFDGLLLTLDFARETVVVAEGTLPPPDGDEVLALDPGELPRLTLGVAGRPTPFLVDTGATHFLALGGPAERELAFRSPVVETGRSMTVAGIAMRRQGRLAGDVTCGRHVVAAPVVAVSAGEGASLGTVFLASFRTTFDLASRRIRLERAAGSPIRTLPVRSPGMGVIPADGAWAVAYVSPESPAARCGLVVGDRIATIDGLPAELVGETMREVLVQTRDALRLGVVRPEGVREVVVEVVTLVE